MTGSNPRRHDGDGGIGDPTTSAPDREVLTGFKPWILLVAAAALTLVACTEEPAEPSGARVGEPPAQFAEPSTRGPPIAADVRKQIALLQQHEDGLARRQARRVRDLFREVEEGIFYLPDADVGPLMTPAGPSGIRQPLSVMEAGIRSKLESPVPRGDISVDRQIGKTLCACWSLPAATRGGEDSLREHWLCPAELDVRIRSYRQRNTGRPLDHPFMTPERFAFAARNVNDWLEAPRERPAEPLLAARRARFFVHPESSWVKA